MRLTRSERLDMSALRSAVMNVVESDRLNDWLLEMPEKVLIQLAAPLEMLQFQYHLVPRLDGHLVRAARVCCRAVAAGMDGCPPDMVEAFDRLAELVSPERP
jgi:hypothetical protein